MLKQITTTYLEPIYLILQHIIFQIVQFFTELTSEELIAMARRSAGPCSTAE